MYVANKLLWMSRLPVGIYYDYGPTTEIIDGRFFIEIKANNTANLFCVSLKMHGDNTAPVLKLDIKLLVH